MFQSNWMNLFPGDEKYNGLKPPNSECKHVCGSKKKSTFYVANKLTTFYLHKLNRIRLITRKKIKRERESATLFATFSPPSET